MANVDLNSAIRNLVSAEVEKTLQPYRQMLERFAQAIGSAPAARGPGRPRKVAAEAAPARRGGRKARKAVAVAGDAAKFSEGQSVRYKQGRGEFEAKVVSVDKETNIVTVERAKDGKVVARPAAKIYAA
jgi:sRNA-binding protein